MTQTLELTPAELEMIALKREQEVLAAKHTETVKAIQLEKDIKAKQEYILATKKKDQEQVDATRKYLLDFDGTQYSIDIKIWYETAQVMGDYIDKDNGFDRHIEWSEVFGRQSASISHKYGQQIKVEEQIVYSSKWSSRGTSKGYKMYISGVGIEWKQQGQALSKVKSVMEKITAAIDKIDNARKREENKKNALQTTVDRFKAEYPDAEVTTDYGYETSYDSSGRRSYSSFSNGDRYNLVQIQFVNGARIAYKVYPDGSLSRYSFNLPGSKDEDTFRNNLSQMNFKND
jgi:hypothetical protein